MKNVLVALAPGFEEIETITVVDILRRAGAKVFLAGTEEGVIEGSRGIRILADIGLESSTSQNWDLLVLPGGQPGTDNLQKDVRILEIVKQMNVDNKLIAAICAAPLVLQSAGILKDNTITSHPSVEDKLSAVNYSQERVVVDGNIITSRSPGTAMEFAMKLVQLLFGEDRLEVVNKGVLAKL
jgi:4-methyl-5(b-hydroxyethyl)-thiazole monophosphate biosynthesis